MASKRSQLPHAAGASASSAWKRWAFTPVVAGEVLFIGYLIAEAFLTAGERRLWYLLGAGGVSLVVGAVVWSRLRQNSSRS